MYLSAIINLAGLSVAFNSLWLLLGIPVFGYAVWILAIRKEESYLENRFGKKYHAYKRRVPRWFGPF